MKIGEFSFSANGKALIKQQAEGKVKIMAEPEFGEIVGVSMIGPDVTELIGQAAAIMNGEMTAAEHFIAGLYRKHCIVMRRPSDFIGNIA